MPDYLLSVPRGYDPTSQAIVGLMAASLDDESRRLREIVSGLEVEHLEWQERPGRNSIGMLMAHLAAMEIAWFYVVCAGLSHDENERVIQDHLGVGDICGMPLPADGVHPESLKGRDLESYFALLARARRATHERLKTWDDPSLDATLDFFRLTLSRRWVLYHVLEHFAGHLGQIGSLLHGMRDHGVPGLPDERLVL